jgi:putative spermidine/putrescine transport system permease protein
MKPFRLSLSQLVAALSILFLLAPFIALVGASFDAGTQFHLKFPPERLSLRSYRELSSDYLPSLANSLIVAVSVALIAGVVGVAASVGILRSGTRHDAIWLAVFRAPLQIPMIVSGAVFLQFYYLTGRVLGFNMLNSHLGLIIAHCFVAIPYAVAATYSVMSRLGPSIDEAAQSLGASDWAVLWQVILPAVRPGIVAGLFYSFIVSFGDVPIALYLANGDLQTFPVKIFYDMQFDLKPSMLATSTIVVFVSLIMIIGVQKLAGLDLILPGQRK